MNMITGYSKPASGKLRVLRTAQPLKSLPASNQARWGSGFLKQLSTDLIAEYPEAKGFSYNNLAYIKRWYLYYNQPLADSGTTCANIEPADLDSFSGSKAAQLPQTRRYPAFCPSWKKIRSIL